MISKFLREQKRYTQKELCEIFEKTDEKIVPIIRKLKEYGVLKVVKASDLQKDMSDLIDEDIEIVDVEADQNEFLYVFTFVGIITVAGCVLKCYPKYLLNVEEPVEELKQIIKILEKYNAKEQIIRMFNDSCESQSFNLLAVLLFLLTDYYENGSYNNTEEVIEINGSGEILWDKTINETFTLLSNNRPYYTDLQTKKRVSDDHDYFKRLHECVLSIASRELSEANLLDLFEITEVNLSDEELNDFGDKEYLLYRIEKELNVQFNTRKQLVLKTLYTYINKGGSLFDIDCLSMFGTNSFNLVWEDVCKVIINNQLERPIGLLNLPIALQPGYNKKTKLIDLIKKPYWSITGLPANDTLIPDSITIGKNGNDYQFLIVDAKYYVAKLEPGFPPQAMPGIESVTKQYLYQLAYKRFIEDHKITSIINCFIMPTESSKVINKGEVSMEILNSLGLQNIKVRFLPAKFAYDCYLTGTKITTADLLL